jgi:hypothetical protein
MRKGFRPLGVMLAIAATAALPATASAAPPTDTQALQDAVTVGNNSSGIRSHLRALQQIADRRGANGTRATGTQGHEDSVTYVKPALHGVGLHSARSVDAVDVAVAVRGVD